jgi:hypothetical protein
MIRNTAPLEPLELALVEDLVEELLGFLVRERRHVERLEAAVDPHLGRLAGLNVQVGATLVLEGAEELVDDGHASLPTATRLRGGEVPRHVAVTLTPPRGFLKKGGRG